MNNYYFIPSYMETLFSDLEKRGISFFAQEGNLSYSAISAKLDGKLTNDQLRRYFHAIILNFLDHVFRLHTRFEKEKSNEHIHYFKSLNESQRMDLFREYVLGSKDNEWTIKSRNSIDIKIIKVPSMFRNTDEAMGDKDLRRSFFKNAPRLIICSFLLHMFQTINRGVYLMIFFLFSLSELAARAALKDLNKEKPFKLSPTQTKAMEAYANLSITQRIAINQFLRNIIGSSIFPPDHECRKCKNELSEHAPLEFEELEIKETDGNEITTLKFCYRDLEKILNYHLKLNYQAFPHKLPGCHFHSTGKIIPVVISGDFGDVDTKLNVGIGSFPHQSFSNYLLGLYNNKENYHYLKSTILRNINTKINNLRNRKVIVIPFRQQYHYFIIPQQGQVSYLVDQGRVVGIKVENKDYLFPSDQPISEEDFLEDSVYYLSFDFFITGDLSWQFMLQGRKTYCTKDCLFCLSKQSNWTDTTSSFPLITQEIMEKARQLKKPKDNFGFDSLECLLDIPMDHWICPILHIEIGLVSFLLDQIFEFNKNNVEYEDQEMISLKAEIALLEGEIAALEDQHTQSEESRKSGKKRTSSMIDQQLETLSKQSKKSSHSNATSTTIILQQDSLKIKKSLLKELEEKKDSLWKKQRKPIQAKIEKVLEKYQIARQAYHSHTLIGQHCQRLLLNHGQILKEIHNLFMNDQERRINVQENLESKMRTFFIYFDELFKVLDGIFFFVFRTGKPATPQEMDELDVLCDYFGKLWRKIFNNQHLSPKFHLVEKHLSSQFRSYGSLGEFSEEHIERLHHQYKVLNRRYCNLTNWSQKYNLMDSVLLFTKTTPYQRIVNIITKTSKEKQPITSNLTSREENIKSIIAEENPMQRVEQSILEYIS